MLSIVLYFTHHAILTWTNLGFVLEIYICSHISFYQSGDISGEHYQT